VVISTVLSEWVDNFETKVSYNDDVDAVVVTDVDDH
jgi:hypothetical protein